MAISGVGNVAVGVGNTDDFQQLADQSHSGLEHTK
jgi:hypothetical protein